MSGAVSRVSVLLPTYNRARFLPAAVAAIAAQSLTDWDLVVVDDGSTDETPAVLDALCAPLGDRVTRVRQENAGAYGARNAALDHARGTFVAFYDSDDLWLPQHLERLVTALDADPDAVWAYSACRIVHMDTGRLIDPDTFRVHGAPRPFLQLRSRAAGHFRVFDDEHAIPCAVTDGLYCGLQNSVLRRTVFDWQRFRTDFRNEGEDQLFVIRALKHGFRVGYVDEVTVEYRVHAQNSSVPAGGGSIERELGVYRPLVRGFEVLRGEYAWTRAERTAIDRRIAQEHFWHIGYGLLWQNGRRAEALASYRAGLRRWPWSLAQWKTYLVARARTALGST